MKDDIIAFSQTSLLEPSVLSVGRFNPEAINSGNITKSQISTSAAIPGSENLMYEFSEYDYDNNEEISKSLGSLVSEKRNVCAFNWVCFISVQF